MRRLVFSRVRPARRSSAVMTRFRAQPRARRGAAGVQPGAVLRPRVRVRDHAGVACAAARPDLGRGLARHARADGRVVGVELHDLGDERARPGRGRGAVAADRDHAREPADGGCDPGGVRRPGAPVRRLVRGDPGGSPPVPHVRRRRTPGRSSASGRATSSPGSRRRACCGSPGGLPTDRPAPSLWLAALGVDYVAPLLALLAARPRAPLERRRGRSRRRISRSASSSSSSSRWARRS